MENSLLSVVFFRALYRARIPFDIIEFERNRVVVQPRPNGKISTHPYDYEEVARAVKSAAFCYGVKIAWGGDRIESPNYAEFTLEEEDENA